MADQPDPPKLTSMGREDHLAAADRLDAILASIGVVPHPTSWPARAIHAVREVPAWAKNHQCEEGLSRGVPCIHLHESLARGQLMADLIVTVDLLNEVLRHGMKPSVEARLRLLAAGDHASTSRGQQSTERNLVFELMCAGWMSRMATDVDLVDPPDVVGTYGGMKWGVSCKNASGTAGSAYASVKKGIDQLEASTCQEGVVLVRMTDVFPHQELIPDRAPGMKSIVSFQDGNQMWEYAMGLARPFVGEVIRHANGGASLFRRSPKLVCVVFVAHSLGNMSTGKGAISTILPIPHFLNATQPPHPFVDDFITAFRL